MSQALFDLERLAFEQKHPGETCKPGDHWDEEKHTCRPLTPEEEEKNKREKRAVDELSDLIKQLEQHGKDTDKLFEKVDQYADSLKDKNKADKIQDVILRATSSLRDLRMLLRGQK